MHTQKRNFRKSEEGGEKLRDRAQRKVQSGQGCFTDPVYFLLQLWFLDSIAASLDHREGPMIIHREKQNKTKRANELACEGIRFSSLFAAGDVSRRTRRNGCFRRLQMNKRTRYFSILFFGNEERRVCRNKPVTLSAIATPNLERCLVRSLEGYCHFRERVTRTVLTLFLRCEELTKAPRVQGRRRSPDESTLRNALILSPLFIYTLSQKNTNCNFFLPAEFIN